MADSFQTLDFTAPFLRTIASRDFSVSERSAILKAPELLEENERHPSLRVHQLHGDEEGSWSASASSVLRITFERLPNGRTRLLTCSRRYDR